MFNDVLQHANLTHWAEAGLVIFFATFIGTVIWAMTRPRKTIERWAMIPLENERPRRGDEQ